MSHLPAYTKIIFDPSQLKTPKTKGASSSSKQIRDDLFNPPILMDEFGQTPDHFYLARKTPSIFQVQNKAFIYSVMIFMAFMVFVFCLICDSFVTSVLQTLAVLLSVSYGMNWSV